MQTEILKKYTKGDKSCLIALLQDIQDKYNYLPENELKVIAEFLEMPLSRVYGVATFYNQFRLNPLGENVIKVCRGTACHVKNSSNILFNIETNLKTKAGETSRDKKFSVEVVNCIGACSIAPVITINDEYYGRVEVKDIPKILKAYNKPKAKTSVKKDEDKIPETEVK